jgi:transposase
MKRFVEGLDRGQSMLFPASLDDYVSEDNPVRAVDVFVDSLDLDKLGFVGVQPVDRVATADERTKPADFCAGLR